MTSYTVCKRCHLLFNPHNNPFARQVTFYDPQKAYRAARLQGTNQPTGVAWLQVQGTPLCPVAFYATRWQHSVRCGRSTIFINSLVISTCTSVKQECGVPCHSESGFRGGGGVAGSVSLLARHASYARGNPNVDFIRDTLPTICSRRHPRASEQSIPDNLKASRTNGVVRIT